MDTRRKAASGKLIGHHSGYKYWMESHEYMFGHDTRRPIRQERYWLSRLIVEGCDPDLVEEDQRVKICRRRIRKLHSTY